MSLYEPLSPVALVLMGMHDALQAQVEALTDRFVYDPTLSVQESVRGQRAIRSQMQLPQETTYPLLSFNRSTLTNFDVMGKKAVQRGVAQDPDDPSVQINYHILFGEIRYTFRYITDKEEELEQFELMYATRTAMSNLTEWKVDLGALGDFPFFAEWEPLSDMDVSREPGYFSIGSTAKLYGQFIMIRRSPSKLVQRIVCDVRDWSARTLYMRFTRDNPGAPVVFTDGSRVPASEIDQPPPGFDPDDPVHN